MAVRVLIVEDDSYFAGILRDYLEYLGYGVEIATDGELGLAACRRQPPDLLISDVLLPRKNGLELSAAVKAERPEVPVLLMSAVYTDDASIRSNLRQCGADDYLIKPFAMPQLREKVRALLHPEAPDDATTDPDLRVVQAPAAVALPRAGSIAQGFLAPVLVAIRATGHTGVLALRDGGRWKDVVFLNGRPVWADGGDDHDRLGTMLLEDGILSREQFERAVGAMQERGIDFGSALTDLGLLTATRLYRELRRLVLRRVVSAFAWTHGDWTLGSLFPRQSSSFEVPPLEAIYQGLLCHGDYAAMRADLAPHEHRFVIPTSRFASDWEELKRDDDINVLGPFLAGERTVNTLRAIDVAPADELDVALWLLFSAGSIGFGDAASPADQADLSMVLPGGAPDRSLTDVGEQIIKAWLKLWQADYFTIFGLHREAGASVVGAATGKPILGWSPETLPANLPEDIRSKASALSAWVAEARATLEDPARRAAYGDRLDEGLTGMYRRVEAPGVAQASMFFQLGKGFIQNRDFAEAERSFTRAAERIPQSAEYQAYLGYAGYRRGGATPEATAEARARLEGALALDPHLGMAWFFLGVIARDQKEYSGAAAALERALECDPGFDPARRSLTQVRMLAHGTRGPLDRRGGR